MIMSSSAKQPTLTRVEPYANKVMAALLFMWLGWEMCTGYYRLTHLWRDQNTLHVLQTKTIPALKHKCDD